MTKFGAQTHSVLIVDDDIPVAELLREILADVPEWTAMIAQDAAAAFAILNQVEISAMVLDLNLPGISGLDLLELIRRNESWAGIPVIAVSATVDQSDAKAALQQAGVVTLLSKPFEIDQVLETVHAVLA